MIESFESVCEGFRDSQQDHSGYGWSRCVNIAGLQMLSLQSLIRCQDYNNPDVERHLSSAADCFIESIHLYRGIGNRKQTLDELNELQIRKGKDYGNDTDTLHNLRSTEDFGIPAWSGSVIRANDKLRRIDSFNRNGVLANESLEDALIDSAVYFLHSLRLWRESNVLVSS